MSETIETTAETPVRLLYTNWRGCCKWRTVVIQAGSLRFGSTSHHPEPGWLIDVFDIDIKEPRTLALAMVHEWQAYQAGVAS